MNQPAPHEITYDATPGLPLITLTMRDFEAGGAQRVMLNLAEGLVAMGHPVDLVVWDESGEWRDQLPDGVRLHVLGACGVVGAALRLAAYLRVRRPAGVLSALLKPNLAAALAGKLAGTRVVASEHSNIEAYLEGKGWLARRLCLLSFGITHRAVEHIVSVSEPASRAAERACGLPAGSVLTVANPVVTPGILSMASAPCPHPWLEAGEPPVVLGVGRLIASKDFASLLCAFAEVPPPARMILVGDGPERVRLEHMAEALGVDDRVYFARHQDNPYAFMARARVLASSSRHESFGNVLVEALACGTEVVAVDCPVGPRYVLDDGRAGTLVPMDHVAMLSSALCEILARPDPEEERQKRQAYATRFGVESAAREYLALLTGTSSPNEGL